MHLCHAHNQYLEYSATYNLSYHSSSCMVSNTFYWSDTPSLFSLSASFNLIPPHLHSSLAAMNASCFLVSTFPHPYFQVQNNFFDFFSLSRTSTSTPCMSNLSDAKYPSFYNLSALESISYRRTVLKAWWWPKIFVIFLLRSAFVRLLEGIETFFFSFYFLSADLMPDDFDITWQASVQITVEFLEHRWCHSQALQSSLAATCQMQPLPHSPLLILKSSCAC